MRICDGIEYELIRQRRKTIGFRIREGKLIVSASPLVPLYEIENCILKKKNWIKKHLDNPLIKVRPDFTEGCDIYFLGNKYQLKYELRREKRVEFRGDQIYISGSSINVIAGLWQQYCAKATEEFIQDIRDSDTHNVFTQVSYAYRFYRSKWGCCYKQRRHIVFNCYLIALPPEAIRYIYYHEHAHLLVANHSRDFYEFLERIYPQYRIGQKISKSYIIE